MKPSLACTRTALVAAALSLALAAFEGPAQSPADIGGRTIQMTITSGTFPFATSGAYRFLPSAVDGSYAIVPISGDVDPSTGTHRYTKTGANTAALVLTDNDVGALTATCTFNTANSGMYLLTSTAAPGASQSGTFVLYAGPSPATIAGATVTVTITSGDLPFAEFGSYRFQPAASGNTYTNTALSGDTVNSSGTYSYSQDSPYTRFISFNDSVAGAGVSLQLSFDSPTTGTAFLRKTGSSGYQTGLFSITISADLPTITAHPVSQTLNAGATVTFSVTATGIPPLSYQWRKSGLPIVGATSVTFTIASVTSADQAGYDVAVTNACGSQTSSVATLTVTMHEPPLITAQPESQMVNAGESVTFTVTATGTPPLTFQWRKNSAPIVGATNATFTIASAIASDQADYDVVVTNAYGTKTSGKATLAVRTQEPPSLIPHYVDANSASPTPPYTNWATAAATIQDAVDAAAAGEDIVVTNGQYVVGGRAVYGGMTNRVAVDKPVTIRSLNGPYVTAIFGRQIPNVTNGDGAIRCVYLVSGSRLAGFALTQGATRSTGDNDREQSGGAVWCESTNAAVSNCWLLANSASMNGGGAYRGTLNNCTLTGNWVTNRANHPDAGGGGASWATLNNCLLSGNSARTGGGAYGGNLNGCTLTTNLAAWGGGAFWATLNNCTLTGNVSPNSYSGGAAGSTLNNCTLSGYCGGVHGGTLNDCTLSNTYVGAYGATLSNCTIIGNSDFGASLSTLNNCTLSGNSTAVYYECTLSNCVLSGNSYIGAQRDCTLNNCTLSDNKIAASQCMLNNCTLDGNETGASQCTLNNCTVSGNTTGAFQCTVNNSILYYNTREDYSGGTYNYCCATPLPPGGFGSNIADDPLFVDLTGGNLRLQSNSPCINAGLNSYAPGRSDLDGRGRIVGGRVDMGAYEFQTDISALFIIWMHQHGLPTDGSADYADGDGDGLNNWQEWVCGTDPRDALSAFRLLTPVSSGGDLVVSWQSVLGVNYVLEESTNLAVLPTFTLLATNVTGRAGTTTFVRTNTAGATPFFYRVRVQH